jgi:two-component system, NtrC family, response regulator AtoC
VARKPIEVVRLLVVTQESAVLRQLSSMAESNSWQLDVTANGWGAMDRVQSGIAPDLLLLDLPRSDSDGLHVLRWLRRLRPELPIILLGGADDAPRKQEAIRLGARDYWIKPLKGQSLETLIRRHLSTANRTVETDIWSQDVEQIGENSFYLWASPIMRELRTQAELLAETNSPVLILGEHGSGKESTARLIHRLSLRSSFGFAKVNCATLPSDLLENELFGCLRNGSGIASFKPGKLEICEKGTVLLQEITEMQTALQDKLLQVLLNKRFVRPGTNTSVDVDVRILATSTTNVESAISDNRLRENLYRRLSGYSIHVPPLRRRQEEVPLLLHYFMRHVAKRFGLSPRVFSPVVLDACESYRWPGNLPELEDFVKRYLIGGGGDPAFSRNESDSDGEGDDETVVRPAALSSPTSRANQSPHGSPDSDSLKSMVRTVKSEAERNAIAAALERTGWNRKAAARALKVSYRTLLYKIEQYQMRPSDSSLTPGSNGFRSNGGFRGNDGSA